VDKAALRYLAKKNKQNTPAFVVIKYLSFTSESIPSLSLVISTYLVWFFFSSVSPSRRPSLFLFLSLFILGSLMINKESVFKGDICMYTV